MIRIIFILITLVMILPVAEGYCEMEKSRLEMDFGTSYKLAKFNQILDPDAEKNLEPVYGLDGSAAAAAIGEYRKGFQGTEEKPVFMFSVGEEGK